MLLLNWKATDSDKLFRKNKFEKYNRSNTAEMKSCPRSHSSNKTSIVLIFLCLYLMTSLEGATSSDMSRKEQEEYLTRYAYMGESSPDPYLASLTNPEEIFKMAVMKFQMMSGLNETGVVDEETKKMMEMPRCGNRDEVGMAMVTKRRRRRYAAQGSKWPKSDLTYRINNYTPDLDRQITMSEIKTAFKHWSDASPLTFTEVTGKSPVDIDIAFVSGDHGDGSKFDGPGRTLAHAFFPQYGGDAHFDEDETWTSRKNSGINLLQVAIHEFGHSLGLSHSDVQESIMAPFYRKYDPNVKLHADDIEAMKYIYGDKRTPQQISTKKSRFTPFPTRQTPSSICSDPTVDAIFAVNDTLYLFKGSSYYVFDSGRMRPDFPKSINDDWPSLPDNIDTAVYVQERNSIYFFKGEQIWNYTTSREPHPSNPQKISEIFQGAPNDIDVAFVWSGNRKLYFIKGSSYYRLSKNNRVDSWYPLKLAYWRGLPAKIDAALNYFNSRTYFFSGRQYYRFNDVAFKVDGGYPKSTSSMWLGCSGESVDAMDDENEKGRNQFIASTASGLQPTIVIFSLIFFSF